MRREVSEFISTEASARLQYPKRLGCNPSWVAENKHRFGNDCIEGICSERQFLGICRNQCYLIADAFFQDPPHCPPEHFRIYVYRDNLGRIFLCQKASCVTRSASDIEYYLVSS